MLRRVSLLLTLLSVTLLLSACRGGALLTDVSLRPPVISPNADGVADIAELHYDLTRQSSLSIDVIDAAGVRHAFREDQRRSRGPRTAYFGGVIADRLLPDGDYTSAWRRSTSAGAPPRPSCLSASRAATRRPSRSRG